MAARFAIGSVVEYNGGKNRKTPETDCDRDGVIEVGGVVGDVPRYASQLEAVESYLSGSQFEEAQLFESGRYVVVVDGSRIVGIVTTDTDGGLYGVRETFFCG